MTSSAGESSTQDRFDLVVIGAGNAGQAAASVVREAGHRVAIIEARDVGGTCPLRGCVPKKVLVAAAEAMDVIARAGVHGITVSAPKLDWEKLIARERTFVEGTSASMEKALVEQGIDVIHGTAKFTGPNEILVGDRKLTANKIVIATGSAPRVLTFPGAEHLVTSEDLLVDPNLPSEIVIIGAGVVAMEFSHVFIRAGARVTILEPGQRALSALDPVCVAHLIEHTRSLGVTIELGATVSEITGENGRFRVKWTRGSETGFVVADRVVNASGRIAVTESLDLEAGNVAHEGPTISVDSYLQSTSNPDVYAAGDAHAGAPQLSALATHAGGVAARNLLGTSRQPLDLRSIPSVVFSVPALASVGLTEAKALAEGYEVLIHENDMRSWRAGRTYGEAVAYARVLADKKTGELLGAHLLGHGAAETIHAFAAVIRRRGKASELREPVYAYPTFHSDLRYLI